MTDLNYLSNVKISENTQQVEEKKQKFTFEKSDGIFAIVFFVLLKLGNKGDTGNAGEGQDQRAVHRRG